MLMKPLKLGNKVADIPVIQGGMGIGISLGNLAGTVAREGGIGIISAAQIGYREEDFDRNPKAANLRAIRKEYEKARKLAPQGIIGFNLMVAMRNYEDYVKAVIDAGADLIVSGAGLPTELPLLAKESDVMLAPIVSTEKSARVILRYWDKKYDRIPDLLVIEGPKAGGHLGFTKEQLIAYGESDSKNPPETAEEKDRSKTQKSYDDEVRMILETVREYERKSGRKIPVVLGGGIDSREAAAHALCLGADGVQVATRFVTTEECDADIRYKETYIQAEEKDIAIVKSPVGMPGRAIMNSFMKRVMAGEQIPHSPCHGCLKKCRPSEIPYCITDALIHAAKGEVEDALLFCGAGAYKAKKLEKVKEVIDSLVC